MVYIQVMGRPIMKKPKEQLRIKNTHKIRIIGRIQDKGNYKKTLSHESVSFISSLTLKY